jgi:hypothetical protein
MAKFKVVEQYTEYVTKVYEVDAESEDEAIEMVQNGDVPEDDCDIEMECSDFQVEEL